MCKAPNQLGLWCYGLPRRRGRRQLDSWIIPLFAYLDGSTVLFTRHPVNVKRALTFAPGFAEELQPEPERRPGPLAGVEGEPYGG